jgi:hypothetical protein
MNTTVTIDKWTAEQIEKYSVKNGISKKDFLAKSFEYFNRNSINPVDDESPKSELEKLRSRVDFLISLQKKHEQILFETLKVQNALIRERATQAGLENLSRDLESRFNDLEELISEL